MDSRRRWFGMSIADAMARVVKVEKVFDSPGSGQNGKVDTGSD